MSNEMEKIKYNGMELQEVTEPQIFEKRTLMVVWDDDFYNYHRERYVVAVARIMGSATVALDECGCVWKHCANIPEKLTPRRATNRELSKWLAHNNGEWTDNCKYVMSIRGYPLHCEKDPIPPEIKIRKWNDGEWHEPTVDYMEIP